MTRPTTSTIPTCPPATLCAGTCCIASRRRYGEPVGDRTRGDGTVSAAECPMSGPPRRRRESFDTVADLYHGARVAYPPEVTGLVVDAIGIRPGTRVLEIGPG